MPMILTKPSESPCTGDEIWRRGIQGDFARSHGKEVKIGLNSLYSPLRKVRVYLRASRNLNVTREATSIPLRSKNQIKTIEMRVNQLVAGVAAFHSNAHEKGFLEKVNFICINFIDYYQNCVQILYLEAEWSIHLVNKFALIYLIPRL